tara:strand:+ start:180 stop:383 length:204 start_codon:yes stop_codon:yes gene_type:complete
LVYKVDYKYTFTKIIKIQKTMKTNQKLNILIEEAAKSVDQINFVDMVRKQKNLTKIGTLEGYRLYDR